MDIHFTCPHCKQPLVVDQSGAGETIPCPSCEQTIFVPIDYVAHKDKPDRFVDWLFRFDWRGWFSSRTKAFWITAGIIAFIGFAFIQPDAAGGLLQLLPVGLVIALYFAPAITGRDKRNAQAILVLNLFLGWTILGWVIALVWATTKDPGEP